MKKLITYSDQELFHFLRDGDAQAFETLYNRHLPRLYAMSIKLTGDALLARDIIQDIFTNLWENREDIEVRYPEAWFRGAVRFQVANLIRDGRIHERYLTFLLQQNTGAEMAAETDVRELQAIIQQAISELPEKCREIFRLSREGHLSNLEIAERLRISPKTVENQMTIALKKMRQAVEPYALQSLIIILLMLS